MNQQEALNKAVVALRRQGGQCMGWTDVGFGGDTCLYEDSEGRRCAVGWLLTSEELAALRAKNQLHEPLRKVTVPLPSLEGLDTVFLVELQRCHDRCEDFKADFEYAVAELARKYGLEVPSETL